MARPRATIEPNLSKVRSTEVNSLDDLHADEDVSREFHFMHLIALNLIFYDCWRTGRCEGVERTDALERHVTCSGVQHLRCRGQDFVDFLFAELNTVMTADAQ